MNRYILKALDETKYNLYGNYNPVTIEFNYNIDFSSARGKIKINLENALEAWTISEFKKFNKTLINSQDAYQAAGTIHDFLKVYIDELTKQKDQLIESFYVDDKKKINDYINKLVKYNEVLVDSFGVDPITAKTAPVYKKCTVYACITDENRQQSIKEFSGLEFTYDGYIFQVYKVEKSRHKYIICPSMGLACGSYYTNIRTAHEYINAALAALKDEKKQDEFKTRENEFIELMQANNIDIPDACRPLFDTAAPAPEADLENDISVQDFGKYFGRVYARLYENDCAGIDSDYKSEAALFDELIKDLKPILTVFNTYRMDYISSDREAAAFIIALKHYIDIGYKTLAGVIMPELTHIESRQPAHNDNKRPEISHKIPYNRIKKHVNRFYPAARYTPKKGVKLLNHSTISVHYSNDKTAKTNNHLIARINNTGPG